jgi:hypothetical protein
MNMREEVKEVKADERTLAVLHSSHTWGFNFITFALLLDIMYRSAVRKEAPWDLFALLFLSGTISIVVLARHKVLGQAYGWKVAIAGAIIAFVVSAAIAAIVIMTKVM